jgi:hypothetical protein
MAPSGEDFARWRDDRVTRWVFAALENVAAENKANWDRASWEMGQCNPLLLAELRTRADAYRAIAEASYEGLCETNGDEGIYDR